MFSVNTTDATPASKRWLSLRNEYTITLLILVLSFLLRVSFVHEPLDRDEGFYAYIGSGLLQGKILYRDLIDIKPPGIYYIYALIIGIFGKSIVAIRLCTAFYSIATVYCLMRLTRYIAGPVAGIWAGLLMAILSTCPGIEASSSNAEVFMLLPLVAATYLVLRGIDSGKIRWYALSGALCGVALLIKTVALPQVLVLVSWLYFVPERKSDLRRFRVICLSYCLSLAGVVALVVGYFYAVGAIDDFIQWNVTFIAQYSKSAIAGSTLPAALISVAHDLLAVGFLAVIGCCWIPRKRCDVRSMLPVVLFPATLIGVWLPGKYFPHYFIQILPVSTMIAGIVIADLSESGGWRRWAVTAILVLGCGGLLAEYPVYAKYSPAEVSQWKYGSTEFIDIVNTADYLRERTTPSAYVYQWGFDPGLYFLADRRSPNKYLANLYVCYAPHPTQALQEVLHSLALKKPEYLVIDSYWSDVLPEQSEKIKNFASENYRQEAMFGRQTIFRLNNTNK